MGRNKRKAKFLFKIIDEFNPRENSYRRQWYVCFSWNFTTHFAILHLQRSIEPLKNRSESTSLFIHVFNFIKWGKIDVQSSFETSDLLL